MSGATAFLWVMTAVWMVLAAVGMIVGLDSSAKEYASLTMTLFLIGALLASKIDKAQRP